MIRIANREYGQNNRVRFHNQTIETFSRHFRGPRFDAAISNMTLVTVPNLRTVIPAIARTLAPFGHFVFTITHPFFWNRYRKYEPASRFDYLAEHAQTGKFRISLDKKVEFVTTHFHRPLSDYVDALSSSSLLLERLLEPMPSRTAMRMYPKPWLFPRFIAAKALYLPHKTRLGPLSFQRKVS